MNDLAAITCFFNFDGDKGRVKNFVEFKDSIEQRGIPLFVVEVISEGHNSILRPVLDKDKHFIEKVFLPILIKGNALNCLSPKIPNKYKYLASINSDKIILNDDWAMEATSLLKKYKLVKIGEPSASGFPIIADRDFFDTVGLFDHDFCGNGDAITFFGATGESVVGSLSLYEKNNLNIFYKILSYKLDCYDFCENNTSTIQSDFKNIIEWNPPSVEEMINLTKEINVERNISYKDLHSPISVKNIKEFNYPSKLIETLKTV